VKPLATVGPFSSISVQELRAPLLFFFQYLKFFYSHTFLFLLLLCQDLSFPEDKGVEILFLPPGFMSRLHFSFSFLRLRRCFGLRGTPRSFHSSYVVSRPVFFLSACFLLQALVPPPSLAPDQLLAPRPFLSSLRMFFSSPLFSIIASLFSFPFHL